MSERQDIVYRDQGTGSTASIDRNTQTGDQDSAPTVSWTLNTGLPQLFRYSAVTFNSHLIHYDRDYCRAQGYPDLLVHGPLQATLLLRLAAFMHDGVLPRVFSYRALRPLFEGAAFSVNAAPVNDKLELWVAEGGGATMRAQAHW